MTPTDQLRVQLLKANNTSYNAIDSMMKKIAKEHNISTTKLHKDFVRRYNMIPDKWIDSVDSDSSIEPIYFPQPFFTINSPVAGFTLSQSAALSTHIGSTK
jgi:hypothetical protein